MNETQEALTPTETIQQLDMFQVSEEVYLKAQEHKCSLVDAMVMLVAEYDIDLNAVNKYITHKLREDLRDEAIEANLIRGQKKEPKLEF